MTEPLAQPQDTDYLGPAPGDPIMVCPICGEKAWGACSECGWRQWSPPDDPDEFEIDWREAIWLTESSGLDGEWTGLLVGLVAPETVS